MNMRLNSIHFQGIRPDCLGGYLMGLGLLSACSKRWPDIRGCWKNGHFTLLLPNQNNVDILNYLLTEWKPPAYPCGSDGKPFWSNAQKKDTKKKSSIEIKQIKSNCSLQELDFLNSHIVSTSRNIFNPIFGTGGNVGKRNLAKVIIDSRNLIQKSEPQLKRNWLKNSIFGYECDIPELASTGTWFVYANKTFNSGQRGFYQEGHLSPWSFLLAFNGALLLIGTIERRLSPKARPYASFPFISERENQMNKDGTGLRQEGEFWAPIWENPILLNEMKTMLQRGLARIGNHAATSPHEFAVAAMGDGVDMGITQFVRFEFRETTSSQVFEAIPQNTVQVNHGGVGIDYSNLIMELLPWINKLPYEPKDSKQKGKYVGFRGPVEQAIIKITERPEDPIRWQSLLLLVADIQKRIDQDRTKGWRTKCIPIPRLSLKWLDCLWPQNRPKEIEIACAIASIGARTSSPLLSNIFGIEIGKNNTQYFPKNRPLRAVWHDRNLVDALGKILRRRLVDASVAGTWPLKASYNIPSSHLSDFINKMIDEEMLNCWIPAMSLLNWDETYSGNIQVANPETYIDGIAATYFFFKPLLVDGMKWNNEESTQHPSFSIRLVSLLQQGDINNAIEMTNARILALGRGTITNPVLSSAIGPRLAASLLIPVSHHDLEHGKDRWLSPK